MKLGIWIRVAILSAGFIFSLKGIQSLNQNGLSPALLDLFQIPTSVSSSTEVAQGKVAQFEKLASLHLCQRPVAYVKRYGSSAKTIKTQGNSSLNSWLAANCSILVKEPGQQTSQGLAPVLTIGFLDGQKATVYGNSEGLYRLAGRLFRSNQLDAALSNMDRLAREL